MIEIEARGAVIPLEAKEKISVDKLEVLIGFASTNEVDDCYFVRVEYPCGMVKNHQLNKSQSVDDVLPAVIAKFWQRYGKHVVPLNPAKSGEIVLFKEVLEEA